MTLNVTNCHYVSLNVTKCHLLIEILEKDIFLKLVKIWLNLSKFVSDMN